MRSILALLFFGLMGHAYSQETDSTFANGQLKFSGDKINGSFTWYYEDGQVFSVVHYSNGIVHGEYVEYFENGKMMTKGNFVDGKEDGEWVYWNEDGEIRTKDHYVNGVLTKQ